MLVVVAVVLVAYGGGVRRRMAVTANQQVYQVLRSQQLQPLAVVEAVVATAFQIPAVIKRKGLVAMVLPLVALSVVQVVMVDLTLGVAMTLNTVELVAVVLVALVRVALVHVVTVGRKLAMQQERCHPSLQALLLLSLSAKAALVGEAMSKAGMLAPLVLFA